MSHAQPYCHILVLDYKVIKVGVHRKNNSTKFKSLLNQLLYR